jgi:hypothetical protein
MNHYNNISHWDEKYTKQYKMMTSMTWDIFYSP